MEPQPHNPQFNLSELFSASLNISVLVEIPKSFARCATSQLSWPGEVPGPASSHGLTGPPRKSTELEISLPIYLFIYLKENNPTPIVSLFIVTFAKATF